MSSATPPHAVRAGRVLPACKCHITGYLLRTVEATTLY